MRVTIKKDIPKQYHRMLRNAVKYAATKIELPDHVKIAANYNDDLLGLFNPSHIVPEIQINFNSVALKALNTNTGLALTALSVLFHELKHMSDEFRGICVCLENGFKYYGVKIPFWLYQKAYDYMPFEIAANRFEDRMLSELLELE